jgi:hypothetical protein
LIGDSIKPWTIKPRRLSSAINVSDHTLMLRRIFDDAAFADLTFANFKLRLDERNDPPPLPNNGTMAGRILVAEMNATSIVIRSNFASKSAGERYRALIPSRTSTRGSLRNFQSI